MLFNEKSVVQTSVFDDFSVETAFLVSTPNVLHDELAHLISFSTVFKQWWWKEYLEAVVLVLLLTGPGEIQLKKVINFHMKTENRKLGLKKTTQNTEDAQEAQT